jgi:two-component system, LytTR family, sensor kinase
MDAAMDAVATSAARAERRQASERPSNPVLWLVGFGAWTALALLAITQSALSLAYRGQPVQWPRLLAGGLLDWYICALFIPPLLWLVRRKPLERTTWPTRLPIYVATTLVFAIAKYALTVPLVRHIFGAQRTLGSVLAGNMISEMMIFWAVVGVLHAVEFYRRFREREAQAMSLRTQLGESQLAALRAQLHPHFLFNALNAATTLVHRDANAADAMLTQLGELLRHALRSDVRHETSLGEELDFLDRYLSIMRTRFGEQLAVQHRIPAALGDALVPTFVLQPLVENALEHGVSRLDGVGCVEIEATSDGESLVLAVRDNGSGERNSERDGLGIGLANTRARLTALYGARAELRLTPRPTGGMESSLRLPLRYAAER